MSAQVRRASSTVSYSRMFVATGVKRSKERVLLFRDHCGAVFYHDESFLELISQRPKCLHVQIAFICEFDLCQLHNKHTGAA